MRQFRRLRKLARSYGSQRPMASFRFRLVSLCNPRNPPQDPPFRGVWEGPRVQGDPDSLAFRGVKMGQKWPIFDPADRDPRWPWGGLWAPSRH